MIKRKELLKKIDTLLTYSNANYEIKIDWIRFFDLEQKDLQLILSEDLKKMGEIINYNFFKYNLEFVKEQLITHKWTADMGVMFICLLFSIELIFNNKKEKE